MATADLAFEKGLPANLDAERFVLGSILLNDSVYLQVAGAVEPEDFSLEKHRRIFAPHEGSVRPRRENRSRHAGR